MCWHERGDKARFNPWQLTESWECKNCRKFHENRTFTTWDDLGALKDKLVEKGDWADFIDYAYINNFKTIRIMSEAVYDFINWLISPTSFCSLVAEWLEKSRKTDKSIWEIKLCGNLLERD